MVLGYEQFFASRAITYFVIEKTILNIYIDC